MPPLRTRLANHSPIHHRLRSTITIIASEQPRPGAEGEQLLLTKGDNNAQDDLALYGGPQWMKKRNVVGKVRGSVLSRRLRRPCLEREGLTFIPSLSPPLSFMHTLPFLINAHSPAVLVPPTTRGPVTRAAGGPGTCRTWGT